MGPQVLGFESAGTEYHSAALMTGGTWPSAKKSHTQTHPLHWGIYHICSLHPGSVGALDHCSCCPTLFRLGKSSTVYLQAVSHADPPDPGRILQQKSNSPSSLQWKSVAVLPCFEHYPVKADWVLGGKKGRTNKRCESECERISAADCRKQATNWLLQGGTWQIIADNGAANFTSDLVLVHYFPLYYKCQKQHISCSVYDRNNPQLRRHSSRKRLK